jgi:hypothetical protein
MHQDGNCRSYLRPYSVFRGTGDLPVTVGEQMRPYIEFRSVEGASPPINQMVSCVYVCITRLRYNSSHLIGQDVGRFSIYRLSILRLTQSGGVPEE